MDLLDRSWSVSHLSPISSLTTSLSYGEVWKAVWRKRSVAVKKLKNVNEKLLEEFQTEAKLMMNLKPHPNSIKFAFFIHLLTFVVVVLQGICIEPLLIVTEYMGNGSLYNLLHSNQPIPDQKLLKFVKGIAKGMVHLHSENIVHRGKVKQG
jgi:serine/threonine protein kinase